MCSLDPSAFAFIPSNMNLNKVFTPIPSPNKEVLEYPFSYIITGDDDNWNEMYNTSDFSRGIPGEEKCSPGDFPNNIVEYYWIHEGQNDEEPWMCLCKISNGCFVFYSASCDYTGFDCQGGMEMIISRDPKSLFYMGMTDKQRNECLNDKNFTF
jgi:hypothetical protein